MKLNLMLLFCFFFLHCVSCLTQFMRPFLRAGVIYVIPSNLLKPQYSISKYIALFTAPTLLYGRKLTAHSNWVFLVKFNKKNY